MYCMYCVYLQTQLFNLAPKKVAWGHGFSVKFSNENHPNQNVWIFSLAKGPMNTIPSGEEFTHDIATKVIVQHRQTHEGQEDQT